MWGHVVAGNKRRSLGIKEDLWKGQEPAFQFTIWIPVSLAPWLGV